MIREGLTFDDVLLVPQHSTIKSRSTVDVSVKWGKFEFNHPIIPANMKSITDEVMAHAVAESGGLAILHRFMSVDQQLAIAEDIVEADLANNFAISIGVKEEDRLNVRRFMDMGVKIFCVDVAHGDSDQCVNTVRWLKELTPKPFIIAGNVATGEAAHRLWEAGADAVKVGIGPGSLCTTRIETGNGVPQLTALMDVVRAKENLQILYKSKQEHREFPIIADGGIKNAGDIVKALCFADMVMVGNIFAGCEETPGEVVSMDGRSYKQYAGSSTHKANHVEGVIAMVPTKGSFESILIKLIEGLKSGCSYQGAHNLTELRDNPEFIRITNAGLRESHPHDVTLK